MRCHSCESIRSKSSSSAIGTNLCRLNPRHHSHVAIHHLRRVLRCLGTVGGLLHRTAFEPTTKGGFQPHTFPQMRMQPLCEISVDLLEQVERDLFGLGLQSLYLGVHLSVSGLVLSPFPRCAVGLSLFARKHIAGREGE